MLAEKGFSLTELMISSVIGILVVVAATRFLASLHHTLLDTRLANALEDELRSLQELITQQVSRADYIAYPPLATMPNLMTPALSSTLQISHFGSEQANSCIIFSYDKDNSGSYEHEKNEILGYRLRNKAIEYRVSSKHCNQGGWHDLTDTKTTSITRFQFALSTDTSWGKAIHVSIDAHSTINQNITSQRQFIIGIPNAR